VSLGNHVTVTDGVSFVTHDGGVWVFREEQPDIDIFGPIRVGNNVFIGINSIIMPGVTIGNNCIIAAGSVVTRDVPDDTIFGGVPAKLIKNISEYREGVLKHALHIRSCRPEEKRSFLLDYFK
jgi:acetyltransferase-like isoleucine patch superfamily enzyme